MSQLLDRINHDIITPALLMLPSHMDTPRARVQTLTICLQESRGIHRWQIVDPARPDLRGPARGLWQFERNGGVRGVLTHPASRRLAIEVCERRGVVPSLKLVWQFLAEDDVLAAALARLLLWTDPAPLPELGRGAEAWDYYLRNWRPGKPHLRTWHGYYAQALNTIEPT